MSLNRAGRKLRVETSVEVARLLVAAGVMLAGVPVASGQIVPTVPPKSPAPAPFVPPPMPTPTAPAEATPAFPQLQSLELGKRDGKGKIIRPETTADMLAINAAVAQLNAEQAAAVRRLLVGRVRAFESILKEQWPAAVEVWSRRSELASTQDQVVIQRQIGDLTRKLIPEQRALDTVVPVFGPGNRKAMEDAVKAYRDALNKQIKEEVGGDANMAAFIMEISREAVRMNTLESMPVFEGVLDRAIAKWPTLKAALGPTDSQMAKIGPEEAKLGSAKPEERREAMGKIGLALSGSQVARLVSEVMTPEPVAPAGKPASGSSAAPAAPEKK